MRRDQKLSKVYQKDKRFEKVIQSLNHQLESAQEEILENLEESFPTIHILGAPRSGTTLVSQLIPSFLPVKHINNFIAAFWKAPLYGIELSKKLIEKPYQSSYTSEYGRTKGLNEPHEFGYFWNYHLQYNSLHQKLEDHEININWSYLALLLNNMTTAFDKPIIFKSFLLGFHANTFHKVMTKSKFIYVKRNLVDNVLSILKLRKELNGNINTWGSIKPKQYNKLKGLNVYEQVVGQVLCLQNEYLNQLKDINSRHKLIISYEKICETPSSFLNEVNRTFLNNKKSDSIYNVPKFTRTSNQINSKELQKIYKARDKILTIFPHLKTLDNL